ncbi:MAG: TOMM precursor leader peptide-binding protein [Alphaproteobacteria bacterium]|nr:TOMM precursor leader peptide-binding protein [Alphaproteobacteria bacterium]MBU0798786.1 TOMM precursor leader peptide-binding protein [Alphaproteobacteria bacterium]MBU0886049.1 TOMM precursor leader peptide-binding protein [Alphaproteobacteria bacterium]MBU1812038.1 TOMM precursor leader peptide-binding protein [Alphaproteobacteria bacterium]MBU2089186.1 TOMM precursor leader peptide-binding protein [Alphaproteobacteria bacterium]
MSTEILTHHLALAPHFSVHLQDDERLLLLSESRSFRLRGQFYRDLLPHLTGALTGGQIVAVFKGKVPEPEVVGMLTDMQAKGYIVPVPARHDGHLAAYWSAQGETPLAVSETLTGQRIGVVPLGQGSVTGAEGAGALLSMLAGSGFAVADPAQADLLIVLVDDYLQSSLVDFAVQADRAGWSWLPFKPGGNSAWIGPRMGAGTPLAENPTGRSDGRRPCYHCLARRLISHRPGDTLVQAPSGGLRPARGWTAGSLALARGMAVAEILQHVRSGDARTDHHLLTIDTITGGATTHLAPRFTDCPHCGAPASTSKTPLQPTPIRLQPVSTGGDGDGGWRALTAEQALARLNPLVSPLTGIVSQLNDHVFGKGLYVTSAAQASGESVDPRANRRLGKPGSAGGKGVTLTQARVSCLAEAVERYASGWVGTEARRPARMTDLGKTAIHPHSILGFSAAQYANRAELNKGTEAMHLIPEPFRKENLIDWSPAWSLTHDEPRWLPTRFCYFDYRSQDVPGDHVFCLGDSNGCASGGTLEEAILQGLLEIVERDSISLWWYNRLRYPAVDLDDLDSAFISAMRDYIQQSGRTLEVLNITSDIGIPVMVAISAELETGTGLTMGFGAHIDGKVAATRAITELNQMFFFNDAMKVPLAPGKKDEFPTAREWNDSATLAQHPYLKAREGAPVDPNALSIRGIDSIDAAVRHCVDRLDEMGHEVVVLNFDRGNLPLDCVRVVVPGLCHFWNRRGVPRLFSAPVAQGLLDKPLKEAELNPLSFFV